MILTGTVGQPITSYAPGTLPSLRQGQLADLVVTELHGKYYEQAYRKNLFFAYSVATAMTAVGTAMVGIQVWNGSSSVNMVIGKVACMIVVTSATVTSIVAATGYGQITVPSSQTAITRVSSGFVGGSSVSGATTPQCSAMNAGTFTNAPTAIWPLMHNTAAINTVGEGDQFQFDFEGSLIIPPGGFFCLATIGATAAASAVNSGVMWEEVPI